MPSSISFFSLSPALMWWILVHQARPGACTDVFILSSNLHSMLAPMKSEINCSKHNDAISLANVPLSLPFRGNGGTVDSDSALRSVGTLLSRVRAPPSASWPEGGP
ncbi:hypothetical protein PoB_001090400 [Plakobranchus ocellatus]|uniref:Secreted protein n=1 Tax=Plakobranchus ocellatus TaxID=259542 RepID=A0AAV3YQU1_9GAST|nr:hypothetical protein PoB_001090400 [Plakobranchus ocellatus]